MPYTHILVAVDLSEQCHAVMQRAMALAQCSQARLSLVHVIEPLAMAFAADVPMDLSLLQQQQTEQAMQRFRQFAAQYNALRDEDRHLLSGQPRHEIHSLAEQLCCDLIVVGSHGRHGLALLLGSTANELLHGARLDVLAVHLAD